MISKIIVITFLIIKIITLLVDLKCDERTENHKLLKSMGVHLNRDEYKKLHNDFEILVKLSTLKTVMAIIITGFFSFNHFYLVILIFLIDTQILEILLIWLSNCINIKLIDLIARSKHFHYMKEYVSFAIAIYLLIWR